VKVVGLLLALLKALPAIMEGLQAFKAAVAARQAAKDKDAKDTRNEDAIKRALEKKQ
jgi:hypothetical protein